MDIDKLIQDAVKKIMTDGPETSAAAGRYDASYAKYMDHTVLKPETTRETVKRFCDEAKEYGFASVCINPSHVVYVAEQLKGTGVKTCCVIGFPLGANTSFIKSLEAMEAVKNGAEEVDMVINIGALKSGYPSFVEREIAAVVNAVRGIPVKVILETSYLNRDEKILVCEMAMQAGAAFVKTATGYGAGGATTEDVALMKSVVEGRLGVKAAGGIRTYGDAQAMVEAGATVLGTSAGLQILADAPESA